MPRLHGYRQRLHQAFWDTLIRTTGNPTQNIVNGARLFGNANIGNLSLTNLQVAGQLASDQTYVVLALRCWLYFNGTNRRANYLQVASQLFWTFIVGMKPMHQGQTWYLPSGGGIYGFDAATSIFNNGEPTHASIFKVARPIILPVRQNFAAQADFFDMGSVSALNLLNSGATDDQKNIAYIFDGAQTRDVE